jgi:hypothetical protein
MSNVAYAVCGTTPRMLGVIMLNVAMYSFIMLNDALPSVIMLNVATPSVVVLNVARPSVVMLNVARPSVVMLTIAMSNVVASSNPLSSKNRECLETIKSWIRIQKFQNHQLLKTNNYWN